MKKHVMLSFVLGMLVSGSVLGQMVLDGAISATNTGAAQYTIPIQVSPGIAGVQPNLALRYSSQGSNGHLGVGWTLDGLSSITRCAKTKAQDGVAYPQAIKYTNDDVYCIDGQRLMKVAGSSNEYRTEIDSFSKIVGNGGDTANMHTWFKVWTKAGEILEYGNTTDSRVKVLGGAAIRAWLLNRQSDTKSNAIVFSYVQDSNYGDAYISAISYATHPTLPNADSRVEFTYALRPDPLTAYQSGYEVTVRNRLTRIDAKRTGETTDSFRYSLSYDSTGIGNPLSVLKSVEKCGGNSCLPPVVFTYKKSNALNIASGSNESLSDNKIFRVFSMDANGDGRADVLKLYLEGSPVSLRAQAWTSDGNKLISASNTAISYTPPDGTQFLNMPVVLLDANADGRTDFFFILPDPYSSADAIGELWLATGTGFTLSQTLTLPGDTWGIDYYSRLFATDLNGDGRQDIIHVAQYQPGTPPAYIHPWISSGSGFTLGSPQSYGDMALEDHEYILDANGDGLADLVQVRKVGGSSEIRVWQFEAGVFVLKSTSAFGTWAATDRVLPLDFNGDGLTDMVRVKDVGSGSAQHQIWLSTGNGFQFHGNGAAGSWSTNDHREFPMDVNGDGRQDIIRLWKNGSDTWLEPWLNDGTAFTAQTSFYVGYWDESRDRELLADFTGTGIGTLLRVFRNQSNLSELRAHWWNPKVANEYSLSSVDNGVGGVIEITYGPLSSGGSFYQKDTGAQAAAYPRYDIQPANHVVSMINKQWYMRPQYQEWAFEETYYSYGGLKAELNGRGTLGFRWIKQSVQPYKFMLNFGRNIYTHTEYSQDFPYIGMPTKIETSVRDFVNGSPELLVKRVTNQYACHVPETTASCTITAGKYYHPYLYKVIESAWDLDGISLPTVTTTVTSGSYGNVAKIVKSSSDGYSTTTTNTYYSPNLTNWYIGQLKTSTVTKISP